MSSPIFVIGDDGTKHGFAQGTPPEDILQEMNRYKITQPPSNPQVSSGQNPILKDNPSQPTMKIPGIINARAFGDPKVVGALPAVGSALGGIPGAAVGSVLKQGLQFISPDTYGNEEDPSLGGRAATLAKDTALQGVLPASAGRVVNTLAEGAFPVVARILSKFPFNKSAPVKNAVQSAVNQDLANTAGSMLKPDSGIIEDAAQKASGTESSLVDEIQRTAKLNTTIPAKPPLYDAKGNIIPGTGTPASTQLHPDFIEVQTNYENALGKNSVGKMLIKLHSERLAGDEVAASQTYNQIKNLATSDLTHARNFKMAAGPDEFDSLAVNKIIGKGYTPGGKTIDPEAIANELKSNEVYKEMSSPMKDNLNQFVEIAKDQVKNPQESGSKTLQYVGRKIALTVGVATVGHGVAAPVIATYYLGGAAINKLMSNPQTSRLVVQAMKTGTTAPESTILGKVIENSIRGSQIFLKDSDGKLQEVTLGEKGPQLSPPAGQ